MVLYPLQSNWTFKTNVTHALDVMTAVQLDLRVFDGGQGEEVSLLFGFPLLQWTPSTFLSINNV